MLNLNVKFGCVWSPYSVIKQLQLSARKHALHKRDKSNGGTFILRLQSTVGQDTTAVRGSRRKQNTWCGTVSALWFILNSPVNHSNGGKPWQIGALKGRVHYKLLPKEALSLEFIWMNSEPANKAHFCRGTSLHANPPCLDACAWFSINWAQLVNLPSLQTVHHPWKVPEATGIQYILLSYGFSVDLAFILATLNCVHMLEYKPRRLALHARMLFSHSADMYVAVYLQRRTRKNRPFIVLKV